MDSDPGEPVTHSFIVKIWLEQCSRPAQSSWRGHVTHVPSKKRRHFLELDQVTRFIAGYLVDPRAISEAL